MKSIGKKAVKIFKIKNRCGYAAICDNHLTEGRSAAQAFDRMTKALRRKVKRTKQLLKQQKYKKLAIKPIFVINIGAFYIILIKKGSYMGKGDKRTKKGKIYRGSHGNSRSVKKEKKRSK